MDISVDLKNLAHDHNLMIENTIPDRIPSADLLMHKRGGRNKYFLKGARLGVIYLLLIVVFTSFSLFMKDALRGNRGFSQNLDLNAGIFSANTPGSIVSAFRETVK